MIVATVMKRIRVLRGDLRSLAGLQVRLRFPPDRLGLVFQCMEDQACLRKAVRVQGCRDVCARIEKKHRNGKTRDPQMLLWSQRKLPRDD